MLGSIEHPDYAECRRCPYHKSRERIVFGEGHLKADIVIIGEAPGAEEDCTGRPFSVTTHTGDFGGISGRWLWDMVAMYTKEPEIKKLIAKKSPSIDEYEVLRDMLLEREKIYVTNALCCRMPEESKPVKKILMACKHRLDYEIYAVDPKIVITAGRFALSTMMGETIHSIGKEVGDPRPAFIQGKLGTVPYLVFSTYHPAALARRPDWGLPTSLCDVNVMAIGEAFDTLDFINNIYHEIPMPERGGKP